MISKKRFRTKMILLILGMPFLLPNDLMSQGWYRKNDLDEKVATFLQNGRVHGGILISRHPMGKSYTN